MTGTGRSAIRLADARRQDDRQRIAAQRRVVGTTTTDVEHPAAFQPESHGSIAWMRRRIPGHA